VAGNGQAARSGDGGPATAASLYAPSGIALDAAGKLYIADRGNDVIRVVDGKTKIITTLAGTGIVGFSGDGGPATAAMLSYPAGVAVDRSGNLYIADSANHRIRRVDAATKIISTIAGTGSPLDAGDDGPASAAAFIDPEGIAVDAAGNIFITDLESDRLRVIDAVSGIVTSAAGIGKAGFSGDGALATTAALFNPAGVSVDVNGNIFIADAGNERIRRIDHSSKIITTEAGSTGEGLPATAALLLSPRGIALDAENNLLIADTFHHRIRRVNHLTGQITTVAGTGVGGFAGDGGPATAARIYTPVSVAVDRSGNIFIADDDNYRIRRVDAVTGIITTIAGIGEIGFAGDGGPATSAMIGEPFGVGVDAAGNVYIADPYNARVRRVDVSTGIISTFAGGGSSSADGNLATETALALPAAVAVDSAGNVYIADSGADRVRKVDAATKRISTVAGGGDFLGDGGLATSARLSRPHGVTLDASGNLLIADTDQNRIRKVDASTKIISTIAGTGVPGFSGDAGAAIAAQLSRPMAVAIDSAGSIYIADEENDRIRVISSPVTRRRSVRH
jgi:sugar lactone lactonase YvrE